MTKWSTAVLSGVALSLAVPLSSNAKEAVAVASKKLNSICPGAAS